MKYNYTKENRIEFKEVHSADSFTQGLIKPEDEQELIDSGVDITDYIEPAKTLDDVRAERESLFKSHVDYNATWFRALTVEQKDEVSQYRLDLLDITTQDPTNVTWPTPPSF